MFRILDCSCSTFRSMPFNCDRRLVDRQPAFDFRQAWSGNPGNKEKAQDILVRLAKANSAAQVKQWSCGVLSRTRPLSISDFAVILFPAHLSPCRLTLNPSLRPDVGDQSLSHNDTEYVHLVGQFLRSEFPFVPLVLVQVPCDRTTNLQADSCTWHMV
jgi:hypothetical protein